MKYILMVCFTLLYICSLTISTISFIKYCKLNTTYIKNEDFNHFIYWSMLSHMDTLDIMVNDEENFVIYAKAYLTEKIKDDIELDEEFKKIMDKYPAFSLYEYISKTIDEDIGFRNELHDRFIKIQSTDKEEDDYIVDEKENCTIYNFTDITKELIDFTK